MGKSSSPGFEENFEALLNWLDQDRERAGEQYEIIREQLINIFAWRQAQDPEDLADETIDRVTQRVSEIRQTYSGNPRLYFFGVAKKVLLEAQRRESRSWPLEDTAAIRFQEETDEDSEQLYECLDRCILKLPPERRELLFDYYEGSKKSRADARRALANKLAISPAALRMVMYRTLVRLEKCIQECIKGQSERHGES